MQAQPIELSEAHVSNLRLLIHPPNVLQRKGFALGQLSTIELDKKRRCGCCHKTVGKWEYEKAQKKTDSDELSDPLAGSVPISETAPSSPPPLATITTDQQLTAVLHNGPPKRPGGQGLGRGKGNNKGGKGKEEGMRCQFHPGPVQSGRWACCRNSLMSKPCTKQPAHTPRLYADRELEDQWRFYPTPYRRDDDDAATAVSIDCEMGVNDYGESELIRVSVVDYFSGAVLLDKLVWPDVKMSHWNTRFSGVTARDMHEARQQRTCLSGRAAARRAIWAFVSPETVVVGHAVHGDLVSLRWIHHRVVDTLIIEEDVVRREKARREREEEERKQREREEQSETAEEGAAEGTAEEQQKKPKEPSPPMGLKALAKERLDRTIQIKGRGHDSVEDALATRDLLHWHMTNRFKVN